MVIDGNDTLRAEYERALNRKQPDRPAAPYGDRIARLDLAILGGHPAGGQDVGEK